jgi:N-glycosylase/DNA lyase
MIKGMRDFNLKHILECGQCFRWQLENDGSYTLVALDKVINLKQVDESLIINNTTILDFEKIWWHYFDLGRDYSSVKSKVSIDENMKAAVSYGYGLRLLKQDVWETMAAFIISANKNIPSIKKSIESMAEIFGKEIGYFNGIVRYQFPTPKALSVVTCSEIRETKVGYRDKYILNAARTIEHNPQMINYLKTLSTKEAMFELTKFNGIGNKVASCIALFSLQRYDVFPIDVWIKRMMETLYPELDTKDKMNAFVTEKFDNYAGFAQQYLFYYARENRLGL